MTEVQPHIPPPRVLWTFFAFCTWGLYVFVILAAVPELIVQYWFIGSFGYQDIFWTNI